MPQLTKPNRTRDPRRLDPSAPSTSPRGVAAANHRDSQTRYRPSRQEGSSVAKQRAARRATQHARSEPAPRAKHQHPSRIARFFQGWTLEKTFTVCGIMTGLTLFAIFALDLALAWPLDKASPAADLTFLLSGIVLFLLSLNVASDQVNGRGRKPVRFSTPRS